MDHDSELRKKLYGLLASAPHDAGRIDEELERLTEREDGPAHRDLLREIAGLELDPEEGADHWRATVRRHREMAERLGRPIDVRAAMLDWLLEVEALQRPRFVELETFDQLVDSVHRDGLTGLYNFRFFDEHLRRELVRRSRRMAPVSLVMIDADGFKQFNDRHGHEAGNRALVVIARVLVESLRRHDVCARYGGEEFAVVMTETSKAAAAEVAERVRERVERLWFDAREVEIPEPITVSAGVATYPGDAVEPRHLVEKADEALYEAKAAGRNQVRVHGGNLRSFRRARLAIPGRLRVGPDAAHDVQTTSIGDGGFSVLVGTRLPVGTVIEARLTMPARPRELFVTGRVAYVRQAESGDFETGVRILEVDADPRDGLSAVLDELDGAPA